ncbi:hypothetical protein KM043_011961 [Ampulex compressa]|nr:hypothetical protein KM043_011961 [Ampulex compressa]
MSGEENETDPLRNADNLRSITPDSGSNDVAKEPIQGISIEERLASKMFPYGREIILFFLAFTFTLLAALHSSPPKVSKPPMAKPFFNQSSVVIDFYKGHLGAMIETVTDADFSFVMYYAPWDAESQAVRQEFEKVAQYYHTQIFFAAINCWHPNSECRAQYNKIQSYPVLMLYPARDSGIQYRGIRTFPYMIRFLSAVMNPIVRIHTNEQAKELLRKHDAVLMGFFNFTRINKTPGYQEFYKSAIRSLERDPNRDLVFAMVTNISTTAKYENLPELPCASLHMWNETLRYPSINEWTSENILNWVSNTIHLPSLWLQPPGIKALTLAPYLREGPVLFLFTPRNPLHAENYNYNLIREIGLHYNNCKNNVRAKDIIRDLESNRHTAVAQHSEKSKLCTKLLSESRSQLNESTISVSIQQWINDSCCANVVMNKCALCKKKVTNFMEKETSICTLVSDKLEQVCRGVDIFKLPITEDKKEKYEFCCNKGHVTIKLQEHQKFTSLKYKTSILTGENDPRSANSVRRAFIKDDCRKWLTGNNYHQPVFPRDSIKDPNINLTDSICKINKTLALIAIDSLHYFHFAEGLGIDVLKRTDKTAVVILDAAAESQYVMQHNFSRHNLLRFINNYTQGLLQRTLRSNNSKRYAQKIMEPENCKKNGRDKICIPELTTETFLNTILDQTKDVVVMYHSPYCGFCSAISFVYLTVAHYFSEMDHLRFVRVDGDNNDLPWEYSMNHFPSILFFPAKRKEDSTVYPFSLPITIPNLINFILANLNGDSYIEALINVCHSGAGEPPNKCIARTRWLCLDIIEQLLRDYRRLMRHLKFLDKRIARNKRKTILTKLEHIRDIHLILGSTNNLREDLHKVQLIRRKYKRYYRVINLVKLDNKMNNSQIRNVTMSEDIGAAVTKADRSEL